ncbi:MAG: YybH family protein [Paracoccaceae bacterium]
MSESEIDRLTERWLDGWNVGDAPFDGAVFREVFAPGEGAVTVFDNVQGDVVVLRSVDDYVATWTPFMAPMTRWSVAIEEREVVASGAMALSTFRLVGLDTRGPDGAAVPFGQYATHVWRELPGHGWRLVHEHLTAYDVAGRAAR